MLPWQDASRKEGMKESEKAFKQQNLLSQCPVVHKSTDFHAAQAPKSAMSWGGLRRSSHCLWDESERALFSGDLASFLVRARKFMLLQPFSFAYVCMEHA